MGSSSVIGGAVAWVSALLSGSIATIIAVLAIGWLGYAMLMGRIELRRGAQVVFGCFMIFGAARMASGILGIVAGAPDGSAPPVAATVQSPMPMQPQGPVQPYDPYAGAALPTR